MVDDYRKFSSEVGYKGPRVRKLSMLTILRVFIRQILPATLAILFVCVAGFPQKRSSRELSGIKGPVRTVRIESRQLKAIGYRQHGVMVDTLIYDDQGRVLEFAEYLPGGNPDIKTTSVYDQHGNKIEHAYYVHDELNHRSTTRYDSRNRKIEQLSFDASGKQTTRFVFQYDNRGKQVWLKVQPAGKRKRVGWAAFDDRGNELERIEFDERGAVNHRYVYTYDAAGNRTSEVDYYHRDGRTRTSKDIYVYNDNGEVIEQSLYFDGALDSKRTYQFDPRGNKTEAVETDGKGLVKKRRTWSYEFDSEGNWTRAVISEWTDNAPNEPLQPTDEQRRIFGIANDATIALWAAAQQGDVARVTTLLRQGADVSASHPDGGTALIKAAARDRRDVVQALLTAGAKVDGSDVEGWTALMWSSEYGRIEIVNLLLASGADPNAKNALGGVPIMPAALNGHIEVLRLLIEKGANVNAAAADGSTALMVSAESGQTEATKFLLSKGADANLKTKDGLTALFFAIKGSRADTINALLEKGVDVNARARDGMTPLMVAAYQSETIALKLLIEKGADINAKTDDGKTALSIAIQANRKEAVELLKQAGAK